MYNLKQQIWLRQQTWLNQHARLNRRVWRAVAATAALVVSLVRVMPGPTDVTMMIFDQARGGAVLYLTGGDQQFQDRLAHFIGQTKG